MVDCAKILWLSNVLKNFDFAILAVNPLYCSVTFSFIHHVKYRFMVL